MSNGVKIVDDQGKQISPGNPLSVTPGDSGFGIKIADSPSADAFGRLRTANPFTIFDSKQIFDNAPLFWDEELETGSGISASHSVNEAATTLLSTLNTAGKFTRQTFMRFNYQPGKSQQIMMTGIIQASGGGTGVQRRIGIFDDDNGLFFEDDEDTMKVVRRTNVTGTPVESKISQVSWNIDMMDGTGPSGITIDWSKTQIFTIDYEWLGVGRIRMGINVNGQNCTVHEFLNSNTLDKVYMSTPNLPLRYQIITTGSSPASSIVAICSTVVSEGGKDDNGTILYKSTEGTHVDCDVENTIYAILGMRLKSTHIAETINLITVQLQEQQGNKMLEWMVILNPTVASTFTYTGVTNSAAEIATGVTANTVTGGTQVGGGYFQSTNKGGSEESELKNAIRLGSKIDSTVDEIVLCIRPVGGSINADIEACFQWRELT